jgi:hypothetical protein
MTRGAARPPHRPCGIDRQPRRAHTPGHARFPAALLPPSGRRASGGSSACASIRSRPVSLPALLGLLGLRLACRPRRMGSGVGARRRHDAQARWRCAAGVRERMGDSVQLAGAAACRSARHVLSGRMRSHQAAHSSACPCAFALNVITRCESLRSRPPSLRAALPGAARSSSALGVDLSPFAGRGQRPVFMPEPAMPAAIGARLPAQRGGDFRDARRPGSGE